ncbi:MAG TPA: SRPBCC family protein [Solirubrobacterales bacterium]|nr:SRPBCC family protein [Solirubrobacterales bacterium]
MGLQDVDIRKTISAGPAEVFRWLGDSSSWPIWTPIDSHRSIDPGDVAGVGEIRVFTTGRVRVREEIVERLPDRRLTYVMLSGLAVKEYRAVVEVEPAPGGCELRWHTTFKPKFPGTGWIYRSALTKVTRRFADGLAAQSEGADPSRDT